MSIFIKILDQSQEIYVAPTSLSANSGCLDSVFTIFVPLVCSCLQLQDVELPALLVIQHLGDGWRHIIQSDWDGQLALAHI